jgi:hypothetical protein
MSKVQGPKTKVPPCTIGHDWARRALREKGLREHDGTGVARLRGVGGYSRANGLEWAGTCGKCRRRKEHRTSNAGHRRSDRDGLRTWMKFRR